MNIFLISQALQDTCVNLSYGVSNDLVYGAFALSTILVGAGVALVAGGAKAAINSRGIKDKKKDASVKADLLEQEIGELEDIEFTNAYAGMEGASYDPKQAQLADLKKRAEYGEPAQREANILAKAQGYKAQGYKGEGYKSEGYTAQGTSIGQLQRGANTGLTNTMNNLQVSTAAAEMQAQEADQALAASQDLAAQAGTGAGGATALAAAAAKSKQGVASSIDQQVKQNEMLRARGEGELQRAQLAQGNLASQFDLGQSQFNVGAVNQAAQFGAQAANQAAQFGADAKNQANRFTADAMNTQERFKSQAQNQFAQSRFQAANAMDQFNIGAQNQFSMADTQSQNQYNLTEFGAGNQMNQFNTSATNEGLKFEAQSGFEADRLSRAGDMDMQGRQYQQQADITQIRGGQSANADALVQGQQNAIRGSITGGIDSAAGFAAQEISSYDGPPKTSDRRLKKNIKLIGKSPLGLNIYSFKYKDKKGIYQGVMSDEIPKEAVIKHTDGFDRVDYSKLDVEFKLID
jgi:hypothetical protein